jgi:VanZ family protein
MAAQRSLATPLLLVYALLIVYASLYPFNGWRWPPESTVLQVLGLSWPKYFIGFDIASNLLGYVPLGALLCLALGRGGMAPRLAFALAATAPALLSYLLECLQHYLPGRVPSLLDWVLNAGGGLCGAAFLAASQRLGWLDRWQALRDRWFVPTSAGALALLLLWPVALLFPAPVPFGLGQLWGEMRAWAAMLLTDTQLAAAAVDLQQLSASSHPPLSPPAEVLAIALGILAPCLVAFSVALPGWRRVALTMGAAITGLGVTTFSTALNFGPPHAMSWLTPATLPGLCAGLLLASCCVMAGRRLAIGLALVALAALVTLVAQAPADPYYALSLQGWEQGRFIRFHGLARWIGWVWPYLAMVWLLVRLARGDRR